MNIKIIIKVFMEVIIKVINMTKMIIRSNLMTKRVRPKVELFRQPCNSHLESDPPEIVIIMIIMVMTIFIMIIMMMVIVMLMIIIITTSSWTPQTPHRKYPHHLGEKLHCHHHCCHHHDYHDHGYHHVGDHHHRHLLLDPSNPTEKVSPPFGRGTQLR